eukprot:gene10741-2830_t
MAITVGGIVILLAMFGFCYCSYGFIPHADGQTSTRTNLFQDTTQYRRNSSNLQQGIVGLKTANQQGYQCNWKLAVLFSFHAASQLAAAKNFLQNLEERRPCSASQATFYILVESDDLLEFVYEEFKNIFESSRFLHKMHGLSDFTLFIEPDVHIIRENWLDALCNLVDTHMRLIGDEEGLWLLGSIPRGKISLQKKLSHRIHINGNAVYNTKSKLFSEFLRSTQESGIYSGDILAQKERNFYQATQHGRAYDVDLASFLFHSKNFAFVQDHLHRFILSPFIQNQWHSKWSEDDIKTTSPATFLVHGGESV